MQQDEFVRLIESNMTMIDYVVDRLDFCDKAHVGLPEDLAHSLEDATYAGMALRYAASCYCPRCDDANYPVFGMVHHTYVVTYAIALVNHCIKSDRSIINNMLH